MLLLPHDFSDEIETLPKLILLNVEISALCSHRVEVLFDLKWDAFCEFCDHFVETARLKAQVTVLEDSEELAIASLEKELALLFQHTRV